MIIFFKTNNLGGGGGNGNGWRWCSDCKQKVKRGNRIKKGGEMGEG